MLSGFRQDKYIDPKSMYNIFLGLFVEALGCYWFRWRSEDYTHLQHQWPHVFRIVSNPVCACPMLRRTTLACASGVVWQV